MNIRNQSIIAVLEKVRPTEFENNLRMDRRRSGRWPCGKELFWRVPRGRRVRRSLIPERSLSGLVIAAEKEDAAPPGTFVIANDNRTRDRHGFHIAVICRTERTADGIFLLFTDILA
jgi:hypothetical protein